MHLFANRPATDRRARARSLTLFAFSIIAVMGCTASVAVGATQYPEDREPQGPLTGQILEFFYPGQSYPAGKAADDLASTMLWEAMQASRAMDNVPRPTGTPPGRTWLAQQLVRIAFRNAMDTGIYHTVRITVAYTFKVEFDMLKVDAYTEAPPPAPAPETGGDGGGGGYEGGEGPTNFGGVNGGWFEGGGGFGGGGSSGGGGVVTIGEILPA